MPDKIKEPRVCQPNNLSLLPVRKPCEKLVSHGKPVWGRATEQQKSRASNMQPQLIHLFPQSFSQVQHPAVPQKAFQFFFPPTAVWESRRFSSCHKPLLITKSESWLVAITALQTMTMETNWTLDAFWKAEHTNCKNLEHVMMFNKKWKSFCDERVILEESNHHKYLDRDCKLVLGHFFWKCCLVIKSFILNRNT